MEIFKSKQKVDRNLLKRVPKDVIEKDIVFKFLKELPFEKLKELVNLKELDFKDEETLMESKFDKDYYYYLQMLREENVIEYNCSIQL